MHLLKFKNDYVEWVTSKKPINYLMAVKLMEERVGLIHKAKRKELIWVLEHPSIYTAGTSANPEELIDSKKFPVYKTGRGGRYTYHGPGQRVIYLMLDLRKRKKDVREFVRDLEGWLINSLASLNVIGKRNSDLIGIWVEKKPASHLTGESKKIASIGIRVRKWISYHGVSININPNLNHFNGIVPCGISEGGVTSFYSLGIKKAKNDIDTILRQNFEKKFNRCVKIIQ